MHEETRKNKTVLSHLDSIPYGQFDWLHIGLKIEILIMFWVAFITVFINGSKVTPKLNRIFII